MSEIEKEGEIMWVSFGKLFSLKKDAEQYSTNFSGPASIERVRLTPEPEPKEKRFYVEEDRDDCPFAVRDRKWGRLSVVKFWPPFADYDFIRELAKSLAARFNERDAQS